MKPFRCGTGAGAASVLSVSVVLVVLGLLYRSWEPGMQIRDGRHDLRLNGIWLQRGWLGDDT